MPYTLTVQFRGLLLWVPSADISQPQPWFGAFLANADQNFLHGLSDDPRLNQHFPLVRFNLSDLKDAPAGIDGQGHWMLNLEDLVIRPDQSPGGRLSVYRGPIGTYPSPGQRQFFFDWVPKLSALLDSGGVYPDCLQTNPVEGFVAARIHLTEGALYADTLSSFAGDYVREAFVPVVSTTNPRLERVIATGVALEMSGLSGDLRICTRSYSADRPGALRTLTFGEPASGSLTIEILNLCADELEGPRPTLPGIDEDFRLNYMLSDVGNDPLLRHQPLPVPVATQFNPGDDGGGEYARCTHPQADPIPQSQVDTLLAVANSIG